LGPKEIASAMVDTVLQTSSSSFDSVEELAGGFIAFASDTDASSFEMMRGAANSPPQHGLASLAAKEEDPAHEPPQTGDASPPRATESRGRAEMHAAGGADAKFAPLTLSAVSKKISGPPKQWQAGGELFPVIRTRLCLSAYDTDPETFALEHPNVIVYFSPHVEHKAPPPDRPTEFAPPGIQKVHKFCEDLRTRLADKACIGRPLVLAVDIFDAKSVTNAAFLLASFLMLECGYTLDEACHPFQQIAPMPYVDYSLGITLFDAVLGMHKAIAKGWVTRGVPAPSKPVCRVCPEMALLGSRNPKLAALHAAGITVVALTGLSTPAGYDEASVRDAGMELREVRPYETYIADDETVLEGVVDPEGVVGLVGPEGAVVVCTHLVVNHGFLSNEAAAYVWVHSRGREKGGGVFMSNDLMEALQARDPREVRNERRHEKEKRQNGASSPLLRGLSKGEGRGSGSSRSPIHYRSPKGGLRKGSIRGGLSSPTTNSRGSPVHGLASPLTVGRGRSSPPRSASRGSTPVVVRPVSSPFEADAVGGIKPIQSSTEVVEGFGDLVVTGGGDISMGPLIKGRLEAAPRHEEETHHHYQARTGSRTYRIGDQKGGYSPLKGRM